MNDIDFVITWVDGSDSDWQRQFERYLHDYAGNSTDIRACRYRDWDLLKYWFRGVERNCPWVRYVHFVTYGHLPVWMNTNHPKLRIVNHCDFIPKECLPTFSSHAIEVNLHRIPNLSDHFVYFNDDVYVGCPLAPSFFFDKNGYPILTAIEMPMASAEHGTWEHALLVSNAVINAHFQKHGRNIKSFAQWATPRPIKGLCKNAICKFIWPNTYLGFHADHLAMPLRKETFRTIWSAERELLEATSLHRFRNCADPNPYLFCWWELAQGTFTANNNRGKYLSIAQDSISDIQRYIYSTNTPLICINDGSDEVNYNEIKIALTQSFQNRYPSRSSFELTVS